MAAVKMRKSLDAPTANMSPNASQRRMTDADNRVTDRLLLSRISVDDVSDVFRLHSDPVAMSTLGGVRTLERSQADVEALSRHWLEHGFGPWIARKVGTGEFVGMGGLRRVMVEETAEIEIGYALMHTFWGLGLATELARTAAHVGFDTLDLQTLVSFTLPTNLRSRRVMGKAGFCYERDFIYKGYPQVLYRQTIDTWRATERAGPFLEDFGRR